MEGLHVDVDGRLRGQFVGFVAQGESLGMEAGGFGDEDYGSVQTEGFVLDLYVSEDGWHGAEFECGERGSRGIPLQQGIFVV